MRLLNAATLALAVGIGVFAAAPSCGRGRARHLAVPLLGDPSAPPAPGAPAAIEAVDCRSEELGRVGHRVTALLPGPGGLWVGTFDAGAARLAGEPPGAAGALAGRLLMVNALALEAGTVWAATQGGLVGLDGPAAGQVLLRDEAVSAFARVDGALIAGTGHGPYRLEGGGAVPVGTASPEGQPLRVNALAAGGFTARRLWIGTSSGAYRLELGSQAAPASWHPLVFGDPPAATNVVTALAVLGDVAVAGTDDGGLARIGPRGEVSALRFREGLANQVNPGAAAASAAAAAFGTQGGGLLVVTPKDGGLTVQRPSGMDGLAVSAVASAGEDWLVGTSDGRVLRVSCPQAGG